MRTYAYNLTHFYHKRNTYYGLDYFNSVIQLIQWKNPNWKNSTDVEDSIEERGFWCTFNNLIEL